MITVEQLIKKYQLIPHPEGGYFRETYRSECVISHQVLPSNFKGDRNYCTGIYFLLLISRSLGDATFSSFLLKTVFILAFLSFIS